MSAAQSVLGICVRRTETEEVSARAGGAQSEQRQGASGLLVIIAVVKFSVLRKPATNHFVIALAIADLAVGLNIPFYVSFYFDVPYVYDPQICLGRYFIALWSTVTSMLLMIAVAFDRYVSIVQPLRYHSMMNHRVSLTVIFVIYIFIFFVIFLLFFGEEL